MPLAKIRSARSRISSFVTVLLITRRKRSDPVSVAIVIVRSPLARRTRTIGSVRSSSRRDAGLMPYPISCKRARMRSISGWSQDAIRREGADGQVVVAGPAETTQVRAPADDLDEESRSELGIGREDARHRRIDGIGGFQRRFADRQRRVLRRGVAGECAVWRVLRFVERRHVKAAFGG